MTGRRVRELDENGMPMLTQPGDYGRDKDGHWRVRLPTWTDKFRNWMPSLDKHTVVEHENGTITVSPSILWDASCAPAVPESWYHGHLTEGVWNP